MTIPARVRDAIKTINAMHGPGTIVILGETTAYNVVRMPTGIPPLDVALYGGLPCGSLIELYGEWMAGKSTLGYILLGKVQQRGGVGAFIDAEHGLDERWVHRFGVNMDELLFSQPDTGEQALDTVLELVRSDVDLIVVDSVAALAPKEELEGVAEDGMEDQKVALLARLMAKGLRVINSVLKQRRSIVLFINQYTENIGALAYYGGGNLKTKGGRALKQYSRMRLEVLREEWITSPAAKKAGVFMGRIGQTVDVRVTKSKVSPPFRRCKLTFSFYTAKELQRFGATFKDGQAPTKHTEKKE